MPGQAVFCTPSDTDQGLLGALRQQTLAAVVGAVDGDVIFLRVLMSVGPRPVWVRNDVRRRPRAARPVEHRGRMQSRKFRGRLTPFALRSRRELTDENGQPITVATPGAPTPEERRRSAQAVQRTSTPPALPPDHQTAHRAAMQRRCELLPETVDW
ncbi:hypothetical protein [Modestobacter marinus]|nr:hypothetical protein [Modestobacter marinus]NIH70151.1 hypothetical protein [Modestobacter marinus]